MEDDLGTDFAHGLSEQGGVAHVAEPRVDQTAEPQLLEELGSVLGGRA